MKTLLLVVAATLAATAQPAFDVKVIGHGTPMLLIPGLASSGETWDSTVAHYKAHYECHVFTMAGFVGVPRIPAPVLDGYRDAIAAYIRDKSLHKPVIVGHSLGGFVALAIAAKYPDLPGKIVIVDADPFLAGIMDPDSTPEKAKAFSEQMRGYMSKPSPTEYEAYVKSGAGTRAMVSKDSDLARLIGWSLASDRTAVTDAFVEMMAADLRPELDKIQCPALVLTTWIGYKEYTDHAKTEANVRGQYARLKGVDIEITDTARHFIMWDDPDWMLAKMDKFLQ
jgi:pimeloyl-ACP methyl ester carboxylesterase